MSKEPSTSQSGPNRFHIQHTLPSGRARVGRLSTSHGEIDTPAFMPVGSQGTVKGLDPKEVRECGFHMILANAYHLFLRPGHELIESLGGLHAFMQWPGAILTDSGGYQMVSLADLCEVTEEGVGFRSHIDGAWHLLSPEKSLAIQVALGSDIMMVLDHCPTFPCTEQQARDAVQRTTRWAKRCAVGAEKRASMVVWDCSGRSLCPIETRVDSGVGQFEHGWLCLGWIILGRRKARNVGDDRDGD